MLVLLYAFAIGIVAGLRSLTAPAAIAWASHFGWLNLSGSRLSFMSTTAALIIFTVLAAGELIADKLPATPKRTALPPLVVRIVLGGLTGACLFVATGQSLGMGAVLGGIGALFGAYAGYEIRRRIVSHLGLKDFVVAIIEDLATISLAWFAVSP